MKPIGILRFPGTNCDRDVWAAVEAMDMSSSWLWHEDRFQPSEYRGFIVPGGFSYGDYLRCGALAAKAPVMASLSEAAEKGMPILGICNGFQILCETQLVPGALVRNAGRRFVDRWVDLKLENAAVFSGPAKPGAHWRLPIAHGEGRFVCQERELDKLFERGQIWLTYGENPNGSLRDVAGVCNERKNVCALMPHPERAMHDWMGGKDGREVFSALLQ